MSEPMPSESDPARTEADPMQAVDEIVYHISHDIRASVRALRELPDWLREDLDALEVQIGPECSRTIELIASHARRLDGMLDGLLTYSRVGRLQKPVRLQPQRLFESVLAELDPGEAPRFFTQFNPVEIAMGDADAARIFHVLVSNALRHARRPDPVIEITSCRSGDHWELLVSDNGPGIAEASKEAVFRPMVKLVSRDEDEGGGMGLAVLRKICERYGGTVHIEDRIRRGGCTFRVRLPVLAVD